MNDYELLNCGWKKNVDNIYIHEKFNILNDDFFIELHTSGGEITEIIEEDKYGNTSIIFSGTIKTIENLKYLMKLLNYDFSLE